MMKNRPGVVVFHEATEEANKTNQPPPEGQERDEGRGRGGAPHTARTERFLARDQAK